MTSCVSLTSPSLHWPAVCIQSRPWLPAREDPPENTPFVVNKQTVLLGKYASSSHAVDATFSVVSPNAGVAARVLATVSFTICLFFYFFQLRPLLWCWKWFHDVMLLLRDTLLAQPKVCSSVPQCKNKPRPLPLQDSYLHSPAIPSLLITNAAFCCDFWCLESRGNPQILGTSLFEAIFPEKHGYPSALHNQL